MSSRSIRVALVDDEDCEAVIYQRLLDKSAVPAELVWHARSLDNATRQLYAAAPDVLFLDCDIPPFSDISQTIPVIRQAGYLGPIIVSSMLETSETRRTALSLGASEAVCKNDLDADLLTALLAPHLD